MLNTATVPTTVVSFILPVRRDPLFRFVSYHVYTGKHGKRFADPPALHQFSGTQIRLDNQGVHLFQ